MVSIKIIQLGYTLQPRYLFQLNILLCRIWAQVLDSTSKQYKVCLSLFSWLFYYFRNHIFLFCHYWKLGYSQVWDPDAQLFYYEYQPAHLKADTYNPKYRNKTYLDLILFNFPTIFNTILNNFLQIIFNILKYYVMQCLIILDFGKKVILYNNTNTLPTFLPHYHILV